MTVRPILSVADPRDVAVLKQTSKPVEAVDHAIRALMDDMVETMHDAPGIGLAAVQVGVPKRIIVMDLSREDAPAPVQHFVNPEITWRSDELFVYEEGCLSVPEIYDEVERPARVRFTYLNYQGERVEEEAEGLYAVCIQHEMDHLEGVLFIDRLSRLKRDRYIAKVRKDAKRAA